MAAARDFIQWVLYPLLNLWGYIYGASGQVWTEAAQDRIEKTTDENRAMSRKYGSQWIGQRVIDCSGLVMWALKQLGVTVVHQARYLYTDWCVNKGTLAGGKREDGSAPLPGTAVFLQGDKDRIHHVGVYIGHGIVVEAKGARYGVVTSGLDSWDHWGELKVVDYTDAARIEDEPEPEIPASRRGDRPEPSGEYPKALVNNPRRWLNVRSGPGENYALRFRVERGSVVDVLYQDAEWWQVRQGKQVGWAFAAYLQLMQEEGPEGDGDPEDRSEELPEAGETEPEGGGNRPESGDPAEAEDPSAEAEDLSAEAEDPSADAEDLSAEAEDPSADGAGSALIWSALDALDCALRLTDSLSQALELLKERLNLAYEETRKSGKGGGG